MKKPSFRALFFFSILCLMLAGCVPSAGVKLGDEAMKKQDFIEAVRQYEAALDQAKGESARKDIETKLAEAKKLLADDYLIKAKQVYSQNQNGRSAAVDKAIAILKEVAQWDDADQRISKQLAEYTKEKGAVSGQLAQSVQKTFQLAGRCEFNQAQQELDKALATDSANSNLLDAKNKIVQMSGLYSAMQDALRKENSEQAAAKYGELSALCPVEMTLDDATVSLIRKTSSSLQSAGKWWQAYKFLSPWKTPQLQDDLQTIRETGSSIYFEEARKAAAESPHKGFLLADRALEMNNKSLEIFNFHRELGDAVNKSLQSYIAIASFDTPSNDPDAGKQFSDSLISYLYEVLPYGINILERDKIDYLLKEKSEANKDVAQLLGVDLIVTGSVSLFKVDKTVDQRAATVKVKSGEATEQNPEYAKMVQLHGPNQKLWPKVPPETISKDSYELVKYNKGRAELKGFGKVSVRIFDTQKGTIAFVKDYDGNVNYSSEFQDEVEGTNIKYIPMKLPTETEAKEEIRKGIVQQIGKVVQASFESREIRLLNQVKFYLDRKEENLAYKPLAEGYFYCVKQGMDQKNPAFTELRKLRDSLLN